MDCRGFAHMKSLPLAFVACAALVAPEALVGSARAAAPEETVTTVQTTSGILFSGGDGATCERAVIIQGAANELDGVASEYRWLSEHHPGWDLIEQSLVRSANRSYDVLDFRTVDGRRLRACFDISDFYRP